MAPDPQNSSQKPISDDDTADIALAPDDKTHQVAAPSFGWNSYAERINGRFAMIGFIALLVLELFTRQDFFTWLGF